MQISRFFLARLAPLFAITCASLALTGCKHADSAQTAAVETSPSKEIPPANPQVVVIDPAKQAVPAAAALPKGVDAKDLDEAEKKILAEILNEQFDPCGKSRSFAAALDAGDCAIAPKLANALVGYLQAGHAKKAAVGLLLKEIERLNTVVQIDTQGSPLRGPAQSKVIVIEFSDFECPFCRRAVDPLEKMQKQYNFALYYKFFPLKLSHPNSEGAAKAAWAALQQGKFWELHDMLFKAEALDWPAVQKLAAKIPGLDSKKFVADFALPAAQAFVDADLKAGDNAGVDGTPTFFVNGHKAETLLQVQEMVRDGLRADGQKLPAEMTADDLGELAPATHKAVAAKPGQEKAAATGEPAAAPTEKPAPAAEPSK